MGVLDRLKAYQRLTSQPETDTIPQPSTEQPQASQGGETLQPVDGHSFLQQFILEMLKKNNVPVQALRFIPGFGEQVQKLLYGDPYEAHTFFADMHYQVQQLLDKDSDWDPVEVVRRQEYAQAEERARYRASTESSTSGTVNGVGADGIGQVDIAGHSDEKIPDFVSTSQSTYYRQQATLQGTMVDGRPESEQTL